MPNISFDNTQIAFAYKSNKQLKKAKFLFSLMGYPFFVSIGTRITPLLVKGKLPFVNNLIRNTIFKQFVCVSLCVSEKIWVSSTTHR